VKTTTTVKPPTTTIRPAPPTTLAPPKDEGETPGSGEGPSGEEPGVVGYAVAPVNYMGALKSSGLRNLIILLILLAGYATWARDTQLMKGSQAKPKSGGNKKK
jgi:hypothetical protein